MSDILQYLPSKDPIAFSVYNKLVSHDESNRVAFFVSSTEQLFLYNYYQVIYNEHYSYFCIPPTSTNVAALSDSQIHA